MAELVPKEWMAMLRPRFPKHFLRAIPLPPMRVEIIFLIVQKLNYGYLEEKSHSKGNWYLGTQSNRVFQLISNKNWYPC